MNIERMKQTKKLIIEQKVGGGKRSTLRERFTSGIPERERSLEWQRDARSAHWMLSSFRQTLKGDSFNQTMRQSTQRKSLAHESQLSAAVKRVSVRDKICEEDTPKAAAGELTPIGEKRGKPTFRVSKTGVSHFSLKQSRGASKP